MTDSQVPVSCCCGHPKAMHRGSGCRERCSCRYYLARATPAKSRSRAGRPWAPEHPGRDWVDPDLLAGLATPQGRAAIVRRNRQRAKAEAEELRALQSRPVTGDSAYRPILRQWDTEGRSSGWAKARDRAYADPARYSQAAADWRRSRPAPGKRRGLNRKVLIPYLIGRDGPECQLPEFCEAPGGLIVIQGVTGSWMPSLDHIIPWSLWLPSDGPDPDCVANLQLAHLRCNLRKHNRVRGQLRTAA